MGRKKFSCHLKHMVTRLFQKLKLWNSKTFFETAKIPAEICQDNLVSGSKGWLSWYAVENGGSC